MHDQIFLSIVLLLLLPALGQAAEYIDKSSDHNAPTKLAAVYSVMIIVLLLSFINFMVTIHL